MKPEVHAALALAARHRRAAHHWYWRSHRRSVELAAKHRAKAQQHLARAARLAGEGET